MTDLTTQTPSPDPTSSPAAARPGRMSGAALIVGSIVLLLIVSLAAAGTGAFRVPPGEIINSVLDRLGMSVGAAPDELATAVLWEVRFPRVVLAILVGAALGMAGAVMQGVFGNPLAEPAIIGVSSGAAVGAATIIVLGLAAFGSWTVVLAAFVGGLVATGAVYGLSRSGGRTEVVTLVLTGIAVNAIGGALIGLLSFVSDDAQLRSITFWNLGSVGSATWRSVGAITPIIVICLLLAPRFARQLDLLTLGERAARHLGVDVQRLRRQLLVLSALLTAAAVAVAGIVAFVGLVVPHLVRMVVGPGHRIVLPASALVGAITLVGADLIARTVAAPSEVPLGVVTALAGAPFFLWLLRRTRARQGGWA